MCCYFCIEYSKEVLSAEQVSKLFSELLMSGDQDHLERFEDIGNGLTEDYKQKLNSEANHLFTDDDFNDPFDPW